MKCFGFFLLLVIGTSASGQVKSLYGKAYDKSEKKLLYHEIHKVTLDANGFNQLVETQYLDSNLKEFANMRSEFKGNLFVPDSQLKDSRLKVTETLSLEGSQARMTVTVEGKKTEEKTIKTDSSFVAGQGFNNFILKYFDELKKGNDKKVSFVVIPLLDFFRFMAGRKGTAKEGESSVDFQIQIASVFLKAFADPIYVKYDTQDKGLLEFRGLSNLSNEKNEKQQVVIKYSNSPPIL